MSNSLKPEHHEAAKMLRQAAESGRPCAPVRHLVGSQDIDAAYAVQRVNNQERIQKGHRPVGSKIGLTSAAVQRQLGSINRISASCSPTWRCVTVKRLPPVG